MFAETGSQEPLLSFRVMLFVLLVLTASAGAARAGILVQGSMEGVPVRFEMGHDRTRVLAEIDGSRHLLDLAGDAIYRLDGARPMRLRAGLLDDGASMLAYRLADWSPGPPVAGHGSRYNVLTVGEEICGEVLSSRWMLEFLGPLVRSVGLMQRLEPAIRPRDRGTCGAIPFDTYARNGWPLMAGWKNATAFETTEVRFDHNAPPDRFALPRDYDE